MKQKLLTLFVLLVTAMTAFADDATGSGVGSETKKSENELGSKGVAYSYTFTEENGSVTMTVKADGTGCVGIDANASGKTCYLDYTYGDERAYNDSPSHTWDDLKAGTVIKVKLWWAVAFGRSETGDSTNPYITYTVKGSKIDDDEAPVMKKAEAISVEDKKATLTLCATDNQMSTLTYTIRNGETVLATVAGKPDTDVTYELTDLIPETAYTLAVTAKDKAGNVSSAIELTFTTKKGYILTAPRKPTIASDAITFIYDENKDVKYTLPNWGQSGQAEVKNVEGSPILHLTNFNYQGMEFADQDMKEMNMVHMDILAHKITRGIRFNPIFRGPKEQPYTIMEPTDPIDQWKSVDIPLAAFYNMDFTQEKVFQFKFDHNDNNGVTDEVYITNLYFYNNGQADGMTITTENQVSTVLGDITAADVDKINKANAMAIDLTKVRTIAADVRIEPLHKNAIIIVSGTEANNTPNSKYDAIKDMKNVVVLGTDGWYRPVNQLVMTDIPGEPLWKGEGINKEWISTEKIGWKLTRTIKAGAHASICLPSGYVIKTIPDGLSVWQPTSYNKETGISFNHKTDEISGNFPFVIRNTTEKDIELAISNEGDINFKNLIADTANKYQLGSSEGTSVWFCGNFEEALKTDGTQWIIKNEGINASIVKAKGVYISPFRAYFTGIPQGAASAKLNFNDEETTGITNVNAAESNDDTLYNLAGQKVNAAYKGIVIKNGKKYLMK